MKDLMINSRVTIPGDQLSVTHARSSGPGGQNVNKVNSKVTLSWQIRGNNVLGDSWTNRVIARHRSKINQDGELLLTSDRFREQPRNLADCQNRLRTLLLECQFPPKRRVATKPTLASRRRRLDEKRKQSQKKQTRRQGKDPSD